jgi:hypothetical protein
VPLNIKKFFNKPLNLLPSVRLTYFIFFFVVLFVGLTRYLAHSEFWSFFYSKFLIGPGYFQESLYSKIIFNMSLIWIHWLPIGNVLHLIIAKLVYVGIGLLILHFVFRFLRKKVPTNIATLTLFFLYFNPIVFWDLPQAKADIMCLLFLVLSVVSFFKKSRRISFIMLVLAMLSTPKSILFLPFLLLPYFFHRKWSFELSSRQKRWAVRFFLISAGIAYVSKTFFKFYLRSYEVAWSYGMGLVAESIRVDFFSDQNAFFIKDLLIFVFPSLIFLILGGLWARIFILTPRSAVQFIIISIYSFFLLAIYPLKHPYYLIPILFLYLLSFFNLAEFKYNNFQPTFFAYGRRLKFAVLFLFIWQLVGIVLVTPINWGLPQFFLVKKLEDLVNFNENILVADGQGSLPHSNIMPQFMGIYDDNANRNFVEAIEKTKPDLILITPKLRSKIGLLRPAIFFDYVHIDSEILARKIELNTEPLLSGDTILDAIKSVSSFPVKIITFRKFSMAATTNLVVATCNDSGLQKLEWQTTELKNCSHFVFRDIEGKRLLKVVPVPYPIFNEDPDLTLREYLDFKNFFKL